jgi:Na+-translocating ferredoxin:NAD+ oxidoreductase RNF subunit RnfB
MPTTDPGKLRAKLARARPRRNAHLRQWYVANHAAQFEAKKAEQENRCAGCKRSFDTPGVRAVVDHRHRGKKFRGVLCDSCNLAIGHAYENPAVLRKLGLYLQSS